MVWIDADNITQISLQRDGQTYAFSLDSLLAPDAPIIYLQQNGHISSQVLPYKENEFLSWAEYLLKFLK